MSNTEFTDPRDRFDVVITRLRSATETVSQALVDLDQRVAPLQMSWSGGSADAHNALHRDLQRRMSELRDVLDKIGAFESN